MRYQGYKLGHFKSLPKFDKKTKYLPLEWHSWHEGGGSFPQIENFIKSLDLSLVRQSKTISAVGREGEVGLILLKNQSNDRS